MKDRKHIKTFEDKTSELNISDVISSKTKEEILKLIKSLDIKVDNAVRNQRI